MPITTNEGGVLYELDTVTANEGGTLYELDTVHSNEGGVLYEIYSGAFGNGANDTLDWLAQYPEKLGMNKPVRRFNVTGTKTVTEDKLDEVEKALEKLGCAILVEEI